MCASTRKRAPPPVHVLVSTDGVLIATEEYAQKIPRRSCSVCVVSEIAISMPLGYDDIPYLLEHEVATRAIPMCM